MTTATSDTTRCLVCGAPELERLFDDVRDRCGVARSTFRFLGCRRCGSASLDPLPTPAALVSYYPDDYTFKRTELGDSLVRRLLRRLEWRAFYGPFYRARLGVLQKLTGRASGRVLEIGCGSGLFLRMLATAGYDVEGLDTSAGDVAHARQLGLTVIRGEIADVAPRGDGYDDICLFYVLEHVRSPIDTLRAAYRMVKPGGSVVVGLPIVDSLQGRLFGRRWSQVTEAPRHVTLPSYAGAVELLERAGFVDVRSAPMPLIDNAGAAALSLLPAASTTRAYGAPRVVSLLARRAGGAMLTLPSLALALVERWSPRSWGGSGLVVFAARKPVER